MKEDSYMADIYSHPSAEAFFSIHIYIGENRE